MNVLVLGGGGKTGRAVVDRAVTAGHRVTTLVHSGPGPEVPGVEVHVGDASDPATVEAAVLTQDAVIDTVGGKTPYRRTTLETDVAAAVVAAMQRHGVRRLVVTSAIGVGDSTAHASPAVRVLVATFLRASTADKAGMEAVVRASGLDWVITRPAVLDDRAATGQTRVLQAGSRDTARAVTRADLAAFLVAQLTSDEHLRRTVTLAG